jgi:hypothetical protein
MAPAFRCRACGGRSESGAPRGERGTCWRSHQTIFVRPIPTGSYEHIRLHVRLYTAETAYILPPTGEGEGRRSTLFRVPQPYGMPSGLRETLADAVWKRRTPPTSRVEKLLLQRADSHEKGGLLTQSTWQCSFRCFSEMVQANRYD